MISLVLLAVLSSVFGFFVGLIPGIHINTLIPFFFSLSINNKYLAILIISFAISQLFSSFLISTFLGLPEDETALSVLPAHRLVLKGHGYEAFLLAIYGLLFSSILTLLFSLFLLPFFSSIYGKIRQFVLFLIIFVSCYTILSERNKRKILYAFLIFLASGFLGILTLYSPIINQQNSLLPLLTGFFGLSSILVSLKEKSKIPKQKFIRKINISRKDFLTALIVGSFGGIIAGFMPGIGSSQAIMLFSPLVSETRKFIVASASVNSANEIFSLLSLYLVKNPRSGASVALQKIFPEFGFSEFLFSLGVLLISLSISFILSLKISSKILELIQRVNYFYLNMFLIAFLSISVFYFSGLYGLIILLSSTSLGILAIKLKIKRVNLMGCLLLPSILFFSNLLPIFLSFIGL